MSATPARRGRVAVIGAGPAGMATARRSTRPATTSWCWSATARPARPATSSTCGRRRSRRSAARRGHQRPRRALRTREFRIRPRPRPRAGQLPDEVVKRSTAAASSACSAPSSTSGCSPRCPPGVLQVRPAGEQHRAGRRGRSRCTSPTASIAEHDVLVGADGIDSLVRRTLWGDAPKREHRLHIFGGFTFDATVAGAEQELCIVHPRPHRAGQLDRRSAARAATATSGGCSAPTTPSTAFTGRPARQPPRGWPPSSPLRCPQLIAATDPGNVQRWVLRDRTPLKQWSKGRVTLVGDAAHPTSPYAAYGAGMSIEDGYFLGRQLAGVDLSDLRRRPRALDAYEDTAQAAHRPAGPAGLDARQGLPPRTGAAAAGPRRRLRPHAIPAEGRRGILPRRDPRPDLSDR